MKRTSLNIVVAIGIALTASSAIAADVKFNPWNQVVNVAQDYRSSSDAIWASFERGFDKGQSEIVTTPAVAEYDPLHEMINVALYSRNDDAPQLLASFERGFDKDQNAIAVIADVAQPLNTAPVNMLTQNVWTYHLISGVGVGFTTKI